MTRQDIYQPLTHNGYEIRPIAPEDNPQVAHIIRTVLEEHGATGEGYASADPETDAMFETYQQPLSVYYVVEKEGEVFAGCGVARLKGTTDADSTCELQKLYVLPEARGNGLGKVLTERCIDAARTFGFGRVYLETLPHMTSALSLYRNMGFEALDARLGDTGHHKCHIWYAKAI